MRLESPLRYPGGKASLSDFLARTITANGLAGCAYFEPFAGGAGAALRLLGDGIVSALHLNDVDPCITAFWRAVLDEPDRFAAAILSVPLTIAEWKKQADVYKRADTSTPFALGFAAFYLNRCNRSGILSGAAPIGGYAQAGKWRIDARFYRETLATRVRTIAAHRAHIHITHGDALRFLSTGLPRGRARRHVFAYLDPPYYANGNRLYVNFYTDRDHRNLARYMQRQRSLKWVMSYDDDLFIREAYWKCRISPFPLQYSLQRKKQAQELVIMPPQVRPPATITLFDTAAAQAAPT